VLHVCHNCHRQVNRHRWLEANAIEYERSLWLKARLIDPKARDWKQSFVKLSIAERRSYEQLVGRLLNKSLDESHGSCALRNPTIGKKIADALDYFHETRVFTGDFVVMPNHVHVLLTPTNGYELEDILHSIKSFSSNEINRALKKDGPFWQRESYDHIVRDFEQVDAYQRYIAANPSTAKIRDGEYILSRAEYREAN